MAAAQTFTCCTDSCTTGFANDGAICSALGDLYVATGGAQWTNYDPANGWVAAAAGTATDYCTFAQNGQHPCDPATGALTWLDLSNNGLAGSLPDSLSALASLSWLNLGGNQLGGTLPDVLGGLTALQYLDLSNNGLSGTLPPSAIALCSIPVVTCSSFAGNALTVSMSVFLATLSSDATSFYATAWGAAVSPGPVPDLAAYPGLTSITLSNTGLTGTLPDALGGLTGLVYLDLSVNALSGPIPESLATLSGLTHLSLGANALSGSIPDILASWPTLSDLNLANNGLSGAWPASLGSATTLTYLDLSNNQLVGDISTSLDDLTALRYLCVPGMPPLCAHTRRQPLTPPRDSPACPRRDLSTNALNGTITDSLGSFSGLSYLCVSCALAGSYPGCVPHLPAPPLHPKGTSPSTR